MGMAERAAEQALWRATNPGAANHFAGVSQCGGTAKSIWFLAGSDAGLCRRVAVCWSGIISSLRLLEARARARVQKRKKNLLNLLFLLAAL